LAAVIALVIVGGVSATVVNRGDSAPTSGAAVGEPNAGSAAAPVVRDSSHRLSTAPDGKVTFVEFLDFECESCRAAFPVIEQLRDQYDGRVTFVARYFPLDGHANAMPAARAVEAAAQQGKFEAMYRKMYETQTQWGEQQTPKDAVFRGFAEELGLDMAAYDAAVDSPEIQERIEVDVADGRALGVQGTPTFFLNGERFEPQSVADLTQALDAALAA
jgi:protein-disulfide isomerase